MRAINSMRRAMARLRATLGRGSGFRAVRTAALLLALLLVLWMSWVIPFGTRPHRNAQHAALLILFLANLVLLVTLPDFARRLLQWANVVFVGIPALLPAALILQQQLLL